MTPVSSTADDGLTLVVVAVLFPRAAAVAAYSADAAGLDSVSSAVVHAVTGLPVCCVCPNPGTVAGSNVNPVVGSDVMMMVMIVVGWNQMMAD